MEEQEEAVAILFEDNEIAITKENLFEKDEPEIPYYSLENDYETEISKEEEFDQQQKKFLSGKTVLKDIMNEDGEIIVKTGDLIDEEMIKRAKNKGKLIEIIMNCKENERTFTTE